MNKITAFLLTAALLLLSCTALAETSSAPTMDDVVSIRAYTDGTVYGTGVVEIEVTYADGHFKRVFELFDLF